MKITDKKALKIVNSIKCYECKESIESYPEDERDGKTDLEIIKDEIDYFVYMFEEVEGSFKGDLDEAKEIRRRTKNYKVTPYYVSTLKTVYTEWDIQRSKNTIAEYRQLKSLLKRL